MRLETHTNYCILHIYEKHGIVADKHLYSNSVLFGRRGGEYII